jgi:hypothetical protein
MNGIVISGLALLRLRRVICALLNFLLKFFFFSWFVMAGCLRLYHAIYADARCVMLLMSNKVSIIEKVHTKLITSLSLLLLWELKYILI